MKRINYKSDFDFLLSLTTADGTSVGWPSWDWRLLLYTRGQQNAAFEVSVVEGEAKNCFNDEGRIHVVCDNHGLGTGVLYGEFYADIPNAIYTDGKELTVTPFPIGITLVPSAGDDATEADIQVLLPFIYRNAYEMAVSAGYQGTLEEYIESVNTLPTAIADAQTATSNANAATSNATDAAIAANGALAKMQRNIVAIEFDVATGRLWAVTDSEDTVLASAEQDRLTGKITLTFDY